MIKHRFSLEYLSQYRTQLMGISAIGILLCHANEERVALPRLLFYIFNFGNIGVDIFLLLSGLGMYYSLSKAPVVLSQWYKTRYKRIIVPYLIITVPFWIFHTIIEKGTVLTFLSYTSTIGYWIHHFGAWFIAFLIFLYAFTPPLYHLFEIHKNRVVICVLLLVIFSLLCSVHTSFSEIAQNIIDNIQLAFRRIPCFLVGLCIGPYCKRGIKISWWVLPASFVIYFVLSRISFLDEVYFAWILSIPFTMMSIAFLQLAERYKIACIDKVLNWFGERSIESYLTNVFLTYFLRYVPWDSYGTNLNYGNYLSYSIVLVFGVIMTGITHKLSKYVIARIDSVR